MAVKCIREYSGKSPFFVYVAYNAPHASLQAKKEDLLRYGFDENKSLFSQKGAYGQIGRGNTKRQTYSAMVTCMDRGVGQIFQAFKNMHIEDNTLVLFLSITAHKKERAAAVVQCVAGSFRNGQVACAARQSFVGLKDLRKDV